jgi:aldehyde dehydrogenase (NAD+)
VGPGNDPRTDLGPLINKAQFNRVQNLIRAGIDEGARLVCGGLGRPDHLVQGYFARPTIFADVSNDMKIAQEEIFGPVLSILPYRDEDHAVEIANDSMYGLAAYVQSSDLNRARTVAGRLRVGTVHLNHPAANRLVPVGGYKCSGNGRENGRWGLEEYLEIKSIQGFNH